MTDPVTGEREPTRERLARVLGTPPPRFDGASRQRELAAERGLRGWSRSPTRLLSAG